MNALFSFFVSVCLTISSLFYGAPIDPPKEASPVKETKPDNSEYVYDRIDGCNDACFYIGRPNEDSLTEIHSSDFGMAESNADNTDCLNSAFDYCASHPGTKLVIDRGVYHFAGDDAIRVYDCRNLLVDGNGSRFIFTSTACSTKIKLCNSSFVEFRNLDTDWDWENDPVGSLVRIVADDDNAHTMDLEFLERSEVNEDIIIKAMTICDPETGTMGADGSSKESYFYQQADGIKKIEKLSANVLRVTQNGSADYFDQGEVYMLRHHVYDATVFRLDSDSNNLTFDNLNIYACSGMAFTVGGNCHRFQIKNTYIGVEKSQANNRHISLGADAIHIADTKGYFSIEGCDISGMGDDAVNVHDNLAYVKETVDSNTVKAIVKFNAQVGTTVGFKNAEFYDIDTRAKITEIRAVDDEYMITFDKPIADTVEVGYIFYNSECNSGNYVIRNNYFHENRARGLLLQSSNGLCENNRFYKTMGQAIKIVMDIQTGLWLEGTGVDNLVIRNNEFDLCNYSSWGTVIDMGTNFDGKQLKAQPFTNIVISGNKFSDCHEYSIIVRSANGIEICNNSSTVNSLKKTYGKISIEKSAHNLTVNSNTFTFGALHRNNNPKCGNLRVWADVLSHGDNSAE